MDENSQLDDGNRILDNEALFRFKCKHCQRELSSRQNLREHLYIHTGEKPYICTEPGCGQSFRQGSLLSMHKRIHSEVRKNRPSKDSNISKCIFPKLTDLIKNNSKKDSWLSSEDSSTLKTQIGDEFYFIRQFIN